MRKLGTPQVQVFRVAHQQEQGLDGRPATTARVAKLQFMPTMQKGAGDGGTHYVPV